MVKENCMEFEGIVLDSNKDRFNVKINDNYFVSCTLSGKIRQSQVKILVGDRVKIETSVYDPQKGRITYRLK